MIKIMYKMKKIFLSLALVVFLWNGAFAQKSKSSKNEVAVTIDLVNIVDDKVMVSLVAPTFTTDGEFENILEQMIDRFTMLDSEAGSTVRRQGRFWELIGMDDKRLVVTPEQRAEYDSLVSQLSGQYAYDKQRELIGGLPSGQSALSIMQNYSNEVVDNNNLEVYFYNNER